MNIETFKQLPILGILRGIEEKHVAPIADAVSSAGGNSIEITMNTNGAPALIKKMVEVSKGRLAVGAGTVLSLDDMHNALNAGATFIVMPVIIDEVMKYCRENAIPVFPGALTPIEIHRAWEQGATMVKVFPAKVYGPGYMKDVKGPLNKIELLACSGVTPENIGEYFENGASAAAFGGGIFAKSRLDDNRYDLVEKDIKALVDGYLNWKASL